jgi:hypothetical protein
MEFIRSCNITWATFPKSSKYNLSFLGTNNSSLTWRNCLLIVASVVDADVNCPVGKKNRGILCTTLDFSSDFMLVVGVNCSSLLDILLATFDGVLAARRLTSEGDEVIGDFDLDGVLLVAIDVDDSAISNCSRKDATPVLVGLGDDSVGDTSRVVAGGDWERGCKIGVCWLRLDRFPFNGVLVAVEFTDVRLTRPAPDDVGDVGKGSDLAKCVGVIFSTDT